MNTDDPYRELTPEEAERAYNEAPEVPMSAEEVAGIVRKVMVADGRVPIGEMAPAEVEYHLEAVLRNASG